MSGGRPRTLEWTEAQDALMLSMRNAGHTWLAIARALGRPHTTVRRRAMATGIYKLDNDDAPPIAELTPDQHETEAREQWQPYRAGHPITWGLINAGLSLEGAPYG